MREGGVGMADQEWVSREQAEVLAGQICAAAGLAAQSECRMLELLGEFDEVDAVRWFHGVKSLAHWLSWCCSIKPSTAREHVRVAKAMRRMPTVTAAFREGRLSYSKVREVTRVVDVLDEQELCELALTATASQLGRMISSYRSASGSRIRQQRERALSWTERDDQMIDFRVRLPKEEAALLIAAITAAKDQFGTPPPAPCPELVEQPRPESAGACPEPFDSSTGSGQAELRTGLVEGQAPESRVDTTPGYGYVDAILDVARVFLETAPEDRSGEDRTLVVVHVGAEHLTQQGASDLPAETPASPDWDAPAGTPAEPDGDAPAGTPAEPDGDAPAGTPVADSPGKAAENALAGTPSDSTEPDPSPSVSLGQGQSKGRQATGGLHRASRDGVTARSNAPAGTPARSDALAGTPARSDTLAETPARSDIAPAFRRPDPTCHVQGVGGIEAETARRLACDAPILGAVVGAGGEVLALGRSRRLVSRAQRRALMIRDHAMCQFPGCHQTRHLQAHHIVAWADGGPTGLTNLILVCTGHHTAVHEGGMTIVPAAEPSAARRWEFVMPDGKPYQDWYSADGLAYLLAEQAPRRQAEFAAVIETVDGFEHPEALRIRPGWRGERFDLHECVQALFRMRLPDDSEAWEAA
jgi:hypothetical protein